MEVIATLLQSHYTAGIVSVSTILACIFTAILFKQSLDARKMRAFIVPTGAMLNPNAINPTIEHSVFVYSPCNKPVFISSLRIKNVKMPELDRSGYTIEFSSGDTFERYMFELVHPQERACIFTFFMSVHVRLTKPKIIRKKGSNYCIETTAIF